MLRPLGRERFCTLLGNWGRGVHGKFKVPVFAHQELDLFAVFWSVQDRGGYEIVSANKQWKARRVLPQPACACDRASPPTGGGRRPAYLRPVHACVACSQPGAVFRIRVHRHASASMGTGMHWGAGLAQRNSSHVSLGAAVIVWPRPHKGAACTLSPCRHTHPGRRPPPLLCAPSLTRHICSCA